SFLSRFNTPIGSRSDAGAHPGIAVPDPPPVTGAAVVRVGTGAIAVIAVGVVVRCGERGADQGAGGETAQAPTPTAPGTPTRRHANRHATLLPGWRSLQPRRRSLPLRQEPSQSFS